MDATQNRTFFGCEMKISLDSISGRSDFTSSTSPDSTFLSKVFCLDCGLVMLPVTCSVNACHVSVV